MNHATIKTRFKPQSDNSALHTSKRPVTHFSGAFLAYAGSTIIALLLALYMHRVNLTLHPLDSKHYQRYHCQTEARTQPSLDILTLFVNSDAQQFTDQLCQIAIIKQQFSEVNIHWQTHTQVDLRSLYQQQYDLVFARLNLIEQVEVAGVINYQLIAQTPSYHSVLLSRQPIQLTNTFFTGKKIGLIDNPYSFSAYRAPKRALETAGINPELYSTHYFSSHPLLRKALENGEIDIIASFSLEDSFNSEGSMAPDSSLFKLPLEQKLSGAGLFLKPSLINTDAHCAIIATANKLIDNQAHPLTSATRVVLPCQEETL